MILRVLKAKSLSSLQSLLVHQYQNLSWRKIFGNIWKYLPGWTQSARVRRRVVAVTRLIMVLSVMAAVPGLNLHPRHHSDSSPHYMLHSTAEISPVSCQQAGSHTETLMLEQWRLWWLPGTTDHQAVSRPPIGPLLHLGPGPGQSERSRLAVIWQVCIDLTWLKSLYISHCPSWERREGWTPAPTLTLPGYRREPEIL